MIVTENVTLDGIMSPIGDWFDPTVQDEELVAVTNSHGAAADALVLGRTTYEEFASYWPGRTGDPVSEYLDGVDKIVVSKFLEDPDWVNTTVIRDPTEIADLKAKPGKDIVVTGSTTLVHWLLKANLVDQVRMFVYPIVQGHGQRLFPDDLAADATLVEARSFTSGVALLTHRLR